MGVWGRTNWMEFFNYYVPNKQKAMGKDRIVEDIDFSLCIKKSLPKPEGIKI